MVFALKLLMETGGELNDVDILFTFDAPLCMPNHPPRLQLIFQAYGTPLFFVTFNACNHRPILGTQAVHSRFVEFARAAAIRNICV